MEEYPILEQLVKLNPFSFLEHRFYTTFDGQVGFISEEDSGGARMVLSNGEIYDFQKLSHHGYKPSSIEEKLLWKLHAKHNVSIVQAGERLINQVI